MLLTYLQTVVDRAGLSPTATCAHRAERGAACELPEISREHRVKTPSADRSLCIKVSVRAAAVSTSALITSLSLGTQKEEHRGLNVVTTLRW